MSDRLKILLGMLSGAIVVLLLVGFFSGSGGMGSMMSGGMMGGGMIFGVVFMLLFWVLVVALVVWIVNQTQ